MKQRTVAVLVALLALMLSPDAVVMAKGMYVRDWITISVRSGPYDDAKIIGMANTNDYLEIVDERDQWSKVRIPAGKDGWVQNRFLTDKTPKALIIDQLNEKVQSLSEDIRTQREENKQLSKENREQKFRISSLTKEIEGARKDYEDLQKASSSYMDLKTDYDTLKARDTQRSGDMELLLKENRRLKTSERMVFTLIGGGFIVLGLVLGIILQTLRSRPKKSGFRF